MITHLNGEYVEKSPAHLIVECGGVGYWVNISVNTYTDIQKDKKGKIFTHQVIREDANILFGFSTLVEREIFRMLISVSGVGPSIARTMLSSMTSEEIQQAIASENITHIKSVKGIGANTAQHVIIDLKDKILKTFDMDTIYLTPSNTNKEEALSALEVLGFNKKQSDKVVSAILKEETDASVEVLIKKALKNL